MNANVCPEQFPSPDRGLSTTPTVPGTRCCDKHGRSWQRAAPGLYFTAELCGWRMEKETCSAGARGGYGHTVAGKKEGTDICAGGGGIVVDG
jgi:hypothetical protein